MKEENLASEQSLEFQAINDFVISIAKVVQVTPKHNITTLDYKLAHDNGEGDEGNRFTEFKEIPLKEIHF
ncbi:MAG: hypothetical protein QM535_19075 [Limnohabitans sp.]|nr:hypothetical protein [Limnohabitans sp.]